MLSDEVIERLKAKIPAIKGDHTIYGITQLDIQCADGEIKQIVLLFERLRVDEPTKYLEVKDVYADVIVKISDEVLFDIATKKIPLQDALDQKLFKIFGDKEIWNLQLKALERILPDEHFKPRPIAPQPSTPDDETFDDWIDYGSLPKMDLADVPEEFKRLTDHFTGLRDKYNAAK